MSNNVAIIAGFALRESVRRRVFVVVALLTVGFLILYALGVWQIAKESDLNESFEGVDGTIVVAATMLGLSMFATLFLGAILAVFLTFSAVRGDAERGLLQPLLVRPLPRGTLLLGRFVAATAVCVVYVIVVFLASVVITHNFIPWWPDQWLQPALELAAAVVVIVAFALAGSIVLSSTANGIAVFMLFGAGLVAGLLGQIAEGVNSATLEKVARISSWAMPFEALYQTSLSSITADTVGFTRLAITLGPFGGAQSYGSLLWPYTVLYLGAIAALSVWAFSRRDL
jgi:ABC-type transport system involved in multi-copper enzyme maturation permease subunit